MFRPKIVTLLLLGALSVCLVRCTPNPHFFGRETPQRQKAAPLTASGQSAGMGIETGVCSYTSMERQGTRMSNGEIYDTSTFVAAHRTLPFGTVVRVTNLRNNKSVVVVIKDRGPWIRGRIIDVSYAAAKKLDMLKEGLVPATVEVISKTPNY